MRAVTNRSIRPPGARLDSGSPNDGTLVEFQAIR
jgi:hypothetical protein